MSRTRATAYVKRTRAELKDAIPKYKWCRDFRIEER